MACNISYYRHAADTLMSYFVKRGEYPKTAEEVDRAVAGTEYEALIRSDGPEQREGVLAILFQIMGPKGQVKGATAGR